MADHIPPDAVERINQRVINATDIIPAAKSPQVRNSVFDVPGGATENKKRTRRSSVRQPVEHASPARTNASQIVGSGFDCAITGDGGLVLLRDGAIEASLSELETLKVQACLMKLAAAKFFATMA